ncbi:MAG: GtrA family protein [Betaproteobacteria bacterium]
MRFLIAGAINTVASYAIYLLLLSAIDYRAAYSVAFVAGLAGGYWANARFVFGVAPAMSSLAGYLVCYGVTYAASIAVLWVAVEQAGVAQPLAMLAALAVAVPLSYALLRLNFASGRNGSGDSRHG